MVGLFFACVGGVDENIEGRVISVDRSFFDDDERKVLHDPFLKGEFHSFLIDASSMNVRSMAQDSFMSVHPADWPEITESEYRTESFAVPFDLKIPVITALEVLGISEERLYSDIGAVAAVYKRKISTLDEYAAAAELRDE
jgi:hypothetical protein